MTLPTAKNRSKYQSGSAKPFKLSRSKVQLFLDCPRCFFLDRKLAISRRKTPPFNLNLAVDELLKKEFDLYRESAIPHPLSEGYVPFQHPDLEIWRANFQGISYHHKETNFILTGAIDDLWQNDKGELIIVDYKATSRNYNIDSVNHLSEDNKKQADFYTFLLQKNGFTTESFAVFLYCNAKRTCQKFDSRLNFDIKMIKYRVDTSWIGITLQNIKKTLEKNLPPSYNPNCDYCNYQKFTQSVNQVQTLF